MQTKGDERVSLPVFVVAAASLAAEMIELVGPEGRHAVVVRRITPGEHILLTDGLGNGVECVVRSVSKQSLVGEAVERRHEPVSRPGLVVVQAVPKGDHAERAVGLLTEVGADLIIPWASGRSVVAWHGDREVKALARWRSTAQAAAKQSRRLRFPLIGPLHTTEQVATLVARTELALVTHECADASGSTWGVPTEGDVVIVVGPEGGITDDELGLLVAHGARPLRLGPTVLRSSTAGAVAAAVVLSRTPRWS